MKIIGSILIICASVAFSYFYEKKQKEKIKHANELYDFIKYIRAQIEYFSTPVYKIYVEYSNKTEYISSLLIPSKNSLKDEYNNFVSNFFANLGKGYKKEQLQLCDYALEYIKNYEKKTRAEYPNKIKVFRALSIFAGFCVVILLI